MIQKNFNHEIWMLCAACGAEYDARLNTCCL